MAPADTGPSARRPRSPEVAAALSFVFPGAGQLYLGRRVSAAVFAFPALVAVAWAALQLGQGLFYFAASMLDQGYALTVMIVVAAFTAWRVASIVHPFLVVRPRRIGPRAAAVLAVLLIATVGMGDVVFSNAYNAYGLPQQIASNNFVDATDAPTPSPSASIEGPGYFPQGTNWWQDYWPSDTPEASPMPGKSCGPSWMAPQAAAPADIAVALAAAPAPLVLHAVPNLDAATESATAEPPPAPTAEPTPTPTAEPTPTPTAELTPAPTAEPTPTSAAEPTPTPSPSPSPTANPRRLTVLLVGVDFIAGRAHALTDSLMLVSINLDTRKVVMVSVPRDTAAFPFYWGGQAPDTFKINGLVKAIAAGKFGSPDTPMVTLANEIGYLVGIKVDYYAAIDMAGFSDLVDLVGGVDIYNPTILSDLSSCTYVPKGSVHLNGTQALHYARSRESTNDYSRAGRQQRVMIALKNKMATPAILPKLGSLLDVAGKSIATNFPLKTSKDYVKVAEHISSISNCVLGPPYNYHPDSTLTGGSWTSRLKLDQVAKLSVYLFGPESRYYGQPGVVPAPCQNRY